MARDTNSSEDNMPRPQSKEVKDLVGDLLIAAGDPVKGEWGRSVFLIGAGCSRSAGIPLAGEIAQDCIIKLARIYTGKTFRKADKALKWLRDKEWVDEGWSLDKLSWGELYGKIFEEHFKTALDQREIILEAIDKSGGKINWAHLCLGELVKRRYIHTVLTTNFDQLVLQGVINTGLLPVVADGIESLTRVTSQPRRPQVVHIHGSMHTYNMLNSERAVKETEHELSLGAMLYRLLQDSKMLVVIGYSGGEEGVMKLLIEATKRFRDMVIYWVIHEGGYDNLSERGQELLTIGHNKFIIPEHDADKLFADIMEELGIGAPEWMERPTSTQRNQVISFAPSKDPDIQRKIEHYEENIRQLDILWEKTEDVAHNLLDKIVTLRLKGKHEEALSLLRDQKGSDNADIWMMIAESAIESGQRSSGKAARKLVKESVSAWERVLELSPRTSNPRLWYKAQKGLGQTLQFLYDELDHKREHLERAVTAYREALKEIDREIEPLDWAETQHNLGNTLQAIGDVKKDVTTLEDAIAAHRAALEVYTPKSTPVDWAETQVNLGDALQILGVLRKEAEPLEQAVIAHQEALRVYTRSGMPSDWSETQDHLGGSLLELGKLRRDVSLLEDAVEAFQMALEFYRAEGDVERSQSVEENIAEVQKEIEKLKI
jgi:tetratricopeptide (TPR) repeat protein